MPPDRLYSPYELPANTAAANAYQAFHPDAVNPSLVPPGGQTQAQNNIQDHIATMAGAGVTVTDSRLTGYTPPASVSGVSPTSGVRGTLITLTGTSLTGVTHVLVGATPCTNVKVVSGTSVTAAIPNAAKRTTQPITVTVNQINITGPTFQVT
jgi:hypothetical protein